MTYVVIVVCLLVFILGVACYIEATKDDDDDRAV